MSYRRNDKVKFNKNERINDDEHKERNHINHLNNRNNDRNERRIENRNTFKIYCMKVINFKLNANKNIIEQFDYFKKICDLTNKNSAFKGNNLNIDNYMIIMNKIIETYNIALRDKNYYIVNFYWDIMVSFIISVKSVYKNILFKRDGPKFISEKSVDFFSIIKRCCVYKDGNLKYRRQISGFLNMTRGLVGWSVDNRHATGEWLKDMIQNHYKHNEDEDINEDKRIDNNEDNNEEIDDIDDEVKDDKKDDDKKEEVKDDKKDEKKEDEVKEEEKDEKDEKKENKKGRRTKKN